MSPPVSRGRPHALRTGQGEPVSTSFPRHETRKASRTHVQLIHRTAHTDSTAAAALMPYAAWCTFATALNAASHRSAQDRLMPAHLPEKRRVRLDQAISCGTSPSTGAGSR
ncbi:MULTISPECIES: tryptophan-rich sensory protein [unclassified Streptomyces]|uniref:tryptophan-rich sensory protein n=1 Tax=unclassified Streptomyces TaxID=2593676 RepID=UPI0027955080|nr:MULTISPECIES: tryptophan-rich sensory protein [unclassified Streptomyces]